MFGVEDLVVAMALYLLCGSDSPTYDARFARD